MCEVISVDILGHVQVVAYVSMTEVALVGRTMMRREGDLQKQTRQELVSGQSKTYYVDHLTVAVVLAQVGYSATIIVSACCHDVVEDVSGAIVEGDAQEFGDLIAFIVQGLAKVSTDVQICVHCNHQRVETSVNQDWRVLIIKLARCYHNLQLLKQMGDFGQQQTNNKEMAHYVSLVGLCGLKGLGSLLEVQVKAEQNQIESVR